jgi:hypothetical protein
MEECKQHMILLLNIEYDAEAEQERGKLCPCTSKTERGILLQLIFKKEKILEKWILQISTNMLSCVFFCMRSLQGNKFTCPIPSVIGLTECCISVWPCTKINIKSEGVCEREREEELGPAPLKPSSSLYA